jgi:uncharacterized protein
MCFSAELQIECIRSIGSSNVDACHDHQLSALKINLEKANQKSAVTYGEALNMTWHQVWSDEVRRRCKDLKCVREAYKNRLHDLEGICAPISELRTMTHKRPSPETRLGILCDEGEMAENCANWRMAKMKIDSQLLASNPKVSELIDDHATINISTVDIDNDGREELRVFAAVGSARCVRSIFFKKTDSTYSALSGRQFGMFSEEGRFCEGDRGSFVRIRGIVYFLEDLEKTYKLFLGSPNGMHLVCAPKAN